MSVFIGYPSFMAYQMMKGKKGNNDGFPSIPGMIARYSALGLTNEQMAENPVWKDLTGNRHDLQMKNFAWKEGSGISDVYPGALVFDGVDDYGVCDNFPVLTKEKGYTVVALRQWITYNQNAIFAIATNASDQSFNGAFTFEYLQKGLEQTISYGSTQTSLSYSKSPFSWQTTSKYNGVDINNGNKEATNLLALGRAYPQRNESANFAIWELVFLDHDATEEELTKIKDYFVKTYPWLFFDQAWTVVGKTNEDEDRATIANITGNGNNLVLSNLGFAEGSGYGLYQQNYAIWTKASNRATFTVTSSKIHVTSVIAEEYADFIYTAGQQLKQKIRITGLPEGVSFVIGRSGVNLKIISEDGIYDVDILDDSSANPIIGYRINRIIDSCDITIEQIPEYEGYLVTDGVDDKIVSSAFGMGKDFTIVGDWKFIDNNKRGTGLVKGSSFYIYNTMIGLDLYINSGSVKNSLDGIKSINAACSDGRAYDRNWNEILANTGNVVGSSGTLEISSSGGGFDRIAFKNLAIYPRILSKDDCIKAYNYLQTLKAK